MRCAVAMMTDDDRALLIGHGIRDADLTMIGRIRAGVSGQLYEPDMDGGTAYVTPVRVIYADTPECRYPGHAVRNGRIVDLVAWHPARPERWALRTGAAEWLGSIAPQYMPPVPKVPIRRSVLSWFRHCCAGLVLLSPNPADQYRLLAQCRGGIIAENAEHQAELRRILARPWPLPRVLIGGHSHAA